MRFIAEVTPGSGIVRTVYEWPHDFTPQFDPEVLEAVDVTDHDPRPAKGWVYHAAFGTFAPPVEGAVAIAEPAPVDNPPPIEAPAPEPVLEEGAAEDPPAPAPAE